MGKFGGNFGAPAYAPRGATRPPGGYGVPGFASRGGRPPFDAPRPPFDSKFEGGRPNFEHGPRTQVFFTIFLNRLQNSKNNSKKNIFCLHFHLNTVEDATIILIKRLIRISMGVGLRGL